MGKTAFRAGMEGLERRDTPSAGAAAAGAVSGHVRAHVTTTKPLLVQGSGSGFVTQFDNRVNGYEVTAGVRGRAGSLGTFTANPTARSYDNGDSVGVITLTAANGDTLVLTLKGTADLTNARKPATAQYRATVASGTGQFAGATGSGHASGTFEVIRGPVHFHFQGRVRLQPTTRV